MCFLPCCSVLLFWCLGTDFISLLWLGVAVDFASMFSALCFAIWFCLMHYWLSGWVLWLWFGFGWFAADFDLGFWASGVFGWFSCD